MAKIFDLPVARILKSYYHRCYRFVQEAADVKEIPDLEQGDFRRCYGLPQRLLEYGVRSDFLLESGQGAADTLLSSQVRLTGFCG